MPRLRTAAQRLPALAPGVLAAALFLPWIGGSFVADDWPVLLRARAAGLSDVPHLFASFDSGWYRPISDIYFAVTWRVVGLHASVHHMIGIALFALTAVLVGALARRVTDDPRAGLVAGVVFAGLAPHAEPVLWIASANELLAGLGAIISLLACVRYSEAGSPRWLAVTWCTYIFAVLSKETALGLPLALAVCAAAGTRPHTGARAGDMTRAAFRRGLTAAGPPALVSAVLVAARLASDLPYDVPLSAGALIKNVAYYFAMLGAAVPARLSDLSASGPAGASALPVAAVGLSVAALLTIVALRLAASASTSDATAPSREAGGSMRLLAVAGAVVAGGLAPVAPIVTERTAYVASIGAALGVAAVIVYAGSAAISSRQRRALACAVAVFVIANAAVLEHRASYWLAAARANERISAQVEAAAGSVPLPSEVWLLGLPDTMRYAYAFRNAYPAAAELVDAGAPVQAVMDVDLTATEGARLAEQALEAERRGTAVVIRYSAGDS